MDEAIVLEAVSKQFGAITALNQIDLHVSPGEFLLLAGPNGAGKTTLLRLLAGLCRPSAGRVKVAGADPHDASRSRTSIGLLSHQTLLYEDLTARENLLFFARLYDLCDLEAEVEQALETAGLSSRADHRVRTFSRGMKQRLALARATLHHPSILLFDEPFTGLDQQAAAALTERLRQFKEQGRTSVMVTHRLDAAAALADRLAILHRGRLRFVGTWERGGAEDLAALYAKHLGR